MNKEVIKAMNKTPKKEKQFKAIKKWWKEICHITAKVFLSPLWLIFKIEDEVNAWLNSRHPWNEERVKEILDYYVPRYADWCEETKSFYFFDNGYGWDSVKLIKRKDRRFWNRHVGFSGGEIRQYLIEKFELEGFKKEIRDCGCGWTDICFRLIEE